MPNRLVSIAILVVWVYATGALLRRDVLPELLIGAPPDLSSVVDAHRSESISRWSILVVDDLDGGEPPRAAGMAETRSRRAVDGWLRLQSSAWFDSKELLKGTRLETPQDERVEVSAVFDVDGRGNLETFRAAMAFVGMPGEVMVLTGIVKNNALVVTSRGPTPLFQWTRSFPYEPREMVQSPLAPLDRLPGLQVGQRWTSRVVSPLTGRVEQVQVAVEARRLITWDSNPVTTFEVVARYGLISARTWVRATDGLVLRQEAPLPFVRILLERLPDRFLGPDAYRNEGPEI